MANVIAKMSLSHTIIIIIVIAMVVVVIVDIISITIIIIFITITIIILITDFYIYVSNVSAIIPAYVMSRFGTRVTVLIGSSLSSLSLVLSYFATSVNYLILSYGVLGGK